MQARNPVARIASALLGVAIAGSAAAQAGDLIKADGFENPVTFIASKIATRDIEDLLADDARWATLRARCERDLNTVVGDIYAGFDWRQAAQDYGLCWNVGTRRGDPRAPLYGKKAVALLKVLARSFPVIASSQNHQFLAFGDGSTRVFTLPMTPLAGTTVRVFTNTSTVRTFTYGGTTQSEVTPSFDSGQLFPVLRISRTLAGATSNGPPEFVPETDFHVSMRDQVAGNSQFNVLHWLGANHPTGNYYVATNTAANSTAVAASAFTISGTTLTFNTAPVAGAALFTLFIGSDYTQTSNRAGGVESVKPDGPGYNMRAMNAGLAYGYDVMRESPDLSPALRQELYGVLNGQVDWYAAAGYEGPGLYPNPIGNYWIRGWLTGTMFTAYATDADNPRALPGGDLKLLARNALHATFDRMATDLAGGYGPQGTYSEGTNQDMLMLYDLWRRLTTLDGAPEDLAPQLAWNANLVPATIHGTKPDRATFYDGGDWNELPATPLEASMRAFVKFEPDHPMSPFARQLLADIGAPVPGVSSDYKSGAGAFPLSYVAQFTGPMYARSDWGTSAVWLSLAAGPIVADHQHLDQGHFTLQRGGDYLLINAGDYGLLDTLPYHNTLGFDDRGAGNLIVYPPGQGYWGPDARISRHSDRGAFAYAEADIADAYVNNDGVRNSVLSALRTFVYVRPDVVFVHDEMRVANAGVKKTFNVNFNSPALARTGDVFAATRGASKLFMRALVPASPSPTLAIASYNGGSNNVTNYQLTTTGQQQGTFLHVFQVADAARPAMATTSYVVSSDGREQGAQVDLGARRWIVLASVAAAPVVTSTVPLAYTLPQPCPCTHVLTNLVPSTNFQVTLIGGGGGTLQASSDAQGVLTFDTNAGVTGVQVR